MGDLAGVYAKIERAKFHALDLQGRLDVALAPDRYSFALDPRDDAGRYVLRILDVPEVDPDWSLIAGDCIMNARGALDHLAWQIVTDHGGSPGTSTKFPIRENPWANGVFSPSKFLPGVTDRRILDLLEQTQPYIAPSGELQDPAQSHLWVLHRFNNIDKHRLLLVMVCALDLGSMYWEVPEGTDAPDFSYYRIAAKRGGKVALFDYRGGYAPPGFDPHPALQVVLNEADFPRFTSDTVVQTLHSLIYWAEFQVIRPFADLLGYSH